MLLQRDGRCGEVFVSGGSTVVRTIMKLIPLSSFCSYFVGSIVGMFYSFFEVKSREFEVEYIKKINDVIGVNVFHRSKNILSILLWYQLSVPVARGK